MSQPDRPDDPEGWDGKGGGRGVQDGEHMYTCGGFISMPACEMSAIVW